ncbi:unnamed protein product [Phytophthora lilii]|uniref:Unnamed protein product n=1 Tax=Phytophthora lilii TaxID=2077276 RepID=A0A9W6TRF0_9STRA|nr:unnamed protein product [Phytophthora lilii]
MLAVQVNVDEPFKVKPGNVGSKWKSLASMLNKGKCFTTHAINEPSLKLDFETLLDKHARFKRSFAGKLGLNEIEHAHVASSPLSSSCSNEKTGSHSMLPVLGN